MFEKKAEEYAEINKPFLNKYDCVCVFKDGAEFGFQKGIKARINTTTISDCPIKDEWHYVKNGDYPKEYKDLWICFITKDDMKDYVRGWYEYDFDNDKHIFKYVDVIGTQYLEDVYAWQTLIPPKEE